MRLAIGYALVIALSFSQAQSQPAFTSFLVDSTTLATASLRFADIDGDSIPDLVGADPDGDLMLWWHNGGQDPPVWTRHVIDASFDLAISAWAEDMDGDGDNDVLGAAWNDNEIGLWRNDGGSPVQWVKQSLPGAVVSLAHDVSAHDMNQDGAMDILGVGSGSTGFVWWESDGLNPPGWTRRTIGIGFDCKVIRAAYVNSDSLPDVVGSSFGNDRIFWFENDGSDPIIWTKHKLRGGFDGPVGVDPIDMDGDGDVDVVGAAYMEGTFSWFRNDGNATDWPRIDIGSGNSAVGVRAADLDRDGRLDVAATNQDPGIVSVFQGDSTLATWTQQVEDASMSRAWALDVADVDGDQDLDLVSASGESGNRRIRWFRNDTVVATTAPASRRSSAGLQVFPNPFRGTTRLHFSLQTPGEVTVAIYDSLGRNVRTREAGHHATGSHVLDVEAEGLAPGVYYAQVESTGPSRTTKLVVLD